MERTTIIYLRVSTRGCKKYESFNLILFEGRRLELEPIAGPKKRGKNFHVILFCYFSDFFSCGNSRSPLISKQSQVWKSNNSKVRSILK